MSWLSIKLLEHDTKKIVNHNHNYLSKNNLCQVQICVYSLSETYDHVCFSQCLSSLWLVPYKQRNDGNLLFSKEM